MKNKKRLLFLLMRTVLLCVIAVCLMEICHIYYESIRHKKEYAALQEVRRAEGSASKQEESDRSENSDEIGQMNADEKITDDILKEEPVMMDRYKSLYAENNDLTGWLFIPGMAIDYPVMQNVDQEYYLHHNFHGEEDRYGCLFVKDFADVNTPGTNFVIYGHNMKDGAMFGELDEYKEQSFFQEHQLIYFDTLYEERTYQIMAVFLSQVYENEEDAFKYYEFYQADTEEEFLAFYESVKAAALYETGVTAEFGDTFLTMSTCAYHVDDGRLAIVAKCIERGSKSRPFHFSSADFQYNLK